MNMKLFVGTLRVYEMMNTDFRRVDEIKFHALDIRNRGNLTMNNGEQHHVLKGTDLRVYPGGSLKAKRLKVNAKTMIIDVLGEVDADDMGYCSDKGINALRLAKIYFYSWKR